MHVVFVYGTLKRGFPNFDEWMTTCRFVGEAETLDAFPLVVGGPWLSPMMIAEPGTGARISGELFEVDDAGLVVLDRLESTHLKNGYERISILATVTGDKDPREVWAYVKHRAVIDVIHRQLGSEYLLDSGYIHPSLR